MSVPDPEKRALRFRVRELAQENRELRGELRRRDARRKPTAENLRQCDGVAGPRALPGQVPESSNARCQAACEAAL